MVLNERVLVLNSSYEPINICGAKRAITLVFKGVAQVEETDPALLVRSPSTAMELPLVVRLRQYVRTPYRNFTFSKKNIFLRDHHTCQYCGLIYTAKDLTLDHVNPRSRGGDADWENLVTCCKLCNLRKGNRTPQEAGMRLIKRPRSSRYHSFLHYIHTKGQVRSKWRKYLFSEYFQNNLIWEES